MAKRKRPAELLLLLSSLNIIILVTLVIRTRADARAHAYFSQTFTAEFAYERILWII